MFGLFKQNKNNDLDCVSTFYDNHINYEQYKKIKVVESLNKIEQIE